jgi:RNA polymerase sigma-70 factor, ECF subfamily
VELIGEDPYHVSTMLTTSEGTIARELETYRLDLTGYCYRMLGSGNEAEDAVQETMVRAWRGADGLHARAALKSWLYKIATNVCVDMMQRPQRRARPMDLASPESADSVIGDGMAEYTWVQPVLDSRVLHEYGDPAELADARETIRLAFVAALQHLPPRQRAVLILRDVLRWQASEVAELLDTSVASVNSALQRARATLDELGPDPAGPAGLEEEQQALLARYVEAFEAYDVDALVALLHEDAMFTMPPWSHWMRGRIDVRKWLLGQGIGCKGSKVLPTQGSGCPALGTYRNVAPGRWEPWGLVILETSDGAITGVHNFIDAELFPQFGLPTYIEA